MEGAQGIELLAEAGAHRADGISASGLPTGWPAALIEDARKRSMDDTADPRDRGFAGVKLFTMLGDRTAAQTVLRALFHAHRSQIRTEDYFFENLLVVAVACREFDFAMEVFAERFPERWCEGIGQFSSDSRDPAVLWTVAGNATCRFDFPERLFATDRTHANLLYWARSLSLFRHYVRHPRCVAGQTRLNVFDVGICPGLAFCDNKPGYFLIPDPMFLSLDAHQQTKERLDAHHVPWNERKPTAFWRGSTTGKSFGHWRTLPRVRLCEIASSAGYSELIDAGLSGIVQMSEQWEAEIRQSGLLRPPVDRKTYMGYKYQIDIDGNTNAWAGFFERLYTGSPVLKVASPFGYEQWFYDRLVKWNNYVPVESEMGDLIEKVEWLKAHDTIARQIGERGRALAASLAGDAERERAVTTLTCALHHFGGRPLATIDFCTDLQPGVRLLEGWGKPSAHGRLSTGIESRLEIASPIVKGDFRFRMALRPVGCEPQRLTVVANGTLVFNGVVSEAQVIDCVIEDSVRRARNPISISLFHPDVAIRRLDQDDGGSGPMTFAISELSMSMM